MSTHKVEHPGCECDVWVERYKKRAVAAEARVADLEAGIRVFNGELLTLGARAARGAFQDDPDRLSQTLTDLAISLNAARAELRALVDDETPEETR